MSRTTHTRVTFRLHIDRFDRADRAVWAVWWRQRRRTVYLTVPRVHVDVPVVTVFRGARARQPKAYLRGTGVITWTTARAHITAA